VSAPAADRATERVDDRVAADEVDVIEAAMATLFRLAGSRRVHEDRRRRSRTELTRTEWDLLRLVDSQGPVRVRDVAELVSLSPAVASRALATLADDGLVARTADPDDGRGVTFRTTRAGRQARTRFQRAMHDELANALESWSARDRAALARLLDRFVEDLRAKGA